MTLRLATIVEGHGEVEAVPVLLRRLIVEQELAREAVEVPRPWRLPKGKMLNDPGTLSRAIRTVAIDASAVLLLLDGDGSLGCELGPSLLAQVSPVCPIPIRVVVAEREYESWFVAGAEASPQSVEAIHDAKGWVGGRLLAKGPYSPVRHQAPLSAKLDLTRAIARSRSLNKLRRDVAWLLAAAPPPQGKDR